MIQKNIIKFGILILCFLVFVSTPVLLMASETDAEIRNYSEGDIRIEYRLVTIGGQIEWKPIGSIPKRSAKVFRNITIGSVIRAQGDNLSREFTINSPPSGKNQVVLKVR